MGAIIRFLRTHPWQRRLLTVSVTIVVAAIAGVVVQPRLSRWLLLRDLRSDDPPVRRPAVAKAMALRDKSPGILEGLGAAILRDLGGSDRQAGEQATDYAIELAKLAPPFVDSLNKAIQDADDERFFAVAQVLWAIDKFYAPQRRSVEIDRLYAYAMIAAETPGQSVGGLGRGEILEQAAFNRRDNAYVRRILASAVGDRSRLVREKACALAAVLGDDAAMSKLLGDQDELVASAAALCAGMGGRGGLYDQIISLMDGGSAERVASAAYAAAALRPKQAAERVSNLLARTSDASLRDRLLHVVVLLDDDRTRQAVLDMLAEAERAGNYPPAMALVAAARVKLTGDEADRLVRDVREVLAMRRKDALLDECVIAAVRAAERLPGDVLAELTGLLENTDEPYRHEAVWVPVAALTGAQAARRNPDDAQRKGAVSALRNLASYYYRGATRRPSDYLTMPVASAAAASALWKLQADGAETAVRDVARAGGRVAGDRLVWDMGRRGGQRALELAFRMLPPRNAPAELKVGNNDERAAGAMLMALSAETQQQREAAARRVTESMAAGGDGRTLTEAYRCALLILGRKEMLPEVRQTFRRFLHRRELTALLIAGDRWALDWLLWGPTSEAEIDGVLTGDGAAEVLAETVPDLPRIGPGAGAGLRLWQVRIMRYYYVLNRPQIRIGREGP